MDILFNIFKVTGMVACIGLSLLVIISMITVPIKKIKEKKILADLEKLANKYIKEYKKELQEEKNKKTTRKPRNAKKSE